ncbi:MAG: SusC/RagA family TonB-linked outer membrane protein [Gemmatirosa sp.]
MPAAPRPRRWAGWALAGALAFVATSASAQTVTGVIAGTVLDRSSRTPLADVRIYVPGTTLSAATNTRGEYRLTNVTPGRVQVGVLRIGYRATSDTVRVTAGATATLNFELTASLTTLSEVVVTGTVGNQERRAQAAQVSSVAATDVKANAAITTVNEMLQSRLPGVSVSSNSGTAGTARQIRIRGASSLSLSNQPIVFVDGIRINEGFGGPLGSGSNQSTDRINDLNPDDIESIEVVKGPAAATLYGADASTGVIQIITKRGRAGSNQFQQTLRTELGAVDQNFSPADNFGACSAALVASTSTNPLCRGQAVGTIVRDNPLLREGGFRTGHDVLLGYTARGGGQSYGYFVSVGSDRNMGTLPNNEFQRQSLRTNFNFVPTQKLTIDAGVQIVRSEANLPDNDNNIFGFLGGSMLGSPLTRTEEGGGWFGGASRDRAAISAIQNSLETRRSIISGSATYIPVSWLKNRFTVGGDILSDEGTRFFPKNSVVAYGGLLDGGSNTQSRINQQRYTLDYVADASHLFFGTLQTNLSLGAQVIASRFDSLGSVGVTFASNSSPVISSASTTSGGQSRFETRQLGYLGQLQLGWADRRFLQLGARLDDFSAFGQATDPILLPKIGASWVVSEEEFAAPLARVFPSLRLRAAYGTTGRAPTAGAALQTLQPAPYAIQATASTATAAAGAVPNNPGNETLKPERGSEIEAGFDATVFTERLALELTYFNKISKDVLLQRPLPPSLGFQANPFVNIGEVRNRGIEVGLTGQLLRLKNLAWESRVNFNTLDNEIVDLGGVSAFGTLNRFTEGYQAGSFVSKRIRSIDLATNRVIVADTLEVIGNVLPSFEGAWSNTFTLFRNLRIATLVDTKRNFYLNNNTDYFRETQLVRSDRRLDPTVLSVEERLRRYGNPTAGQPAFVQENGAPTTVGEVRDAYVQKGDFVRFRELSFSYTLPTASFLRRARVDGGTIGLAFQNVALWTDYEGADPEVVSATGNIGAAQFSRSDFLTLPNPKRTLLRVNLSF